MPRVKRYSPLSVDINDDDEVWEFTELFGDRALRTLLQVLANLEKTENQWRLVGDWSGGLARKVRQQSANVRRQVGYMIEKQWLIVSEQAADGSPLVLSARNYWKFHKRPELKNEDNENGLGSSKGSSLPILPSERNITNSPIVPRGDDFVRFYQFFNTWPEHRQKGKGKALRAWRSINPDAALFQKIMEKVEQLKKSHDWKRDNGRFIPYPATWLNAEGWYDEVDDSYDATQRRFPE